MFEGFATTEWAYYVRCSSKGCLLVSLAPPNQVATTYRDPTTPKQGPGGNTPEVASTTNGTSTDVTPTSTQVNNVTANTSAHVSSLTAVVAGLTAALMAYS